MLEVLSTKQVYCRKWNFLGALGDFDLPTIDWTLNKKGEEFLKTIEDHFIPHLIDSLSHLHGNILNLALTEDSLDIMDIGC